MVVVFYGVFAFRIACVFAVALFLVTAIQTHAQGLVVDQESDNAPEKVDYDNLAVYKQLLMESFIPTLSSIGFVQLELTDYPDSNISGARIGVSLYSGSPSYPTLLGTTELVYLPLNFNNDQIGYSGVTNFYFATPINLTPGQTYYISPDEITGDHVWSVAVTDNTYPYGQLYGGGTPFTPTTDLWFQEGTTTPEPSVLALLVMSSFLIVRFAVAMPNANII